MLEIKLLPNAEVEIIGEISAEIFMSGRNEAMKEFSEEVELKGFRKGKIPENILITHLGNTAILEKMAIIAMEKAYPKIIAEYKIRAIGRPEISITKMEENNPLGFKIKTAILPDITLPDYKSIAKKVMAEREDISATDEDVSKTVESIRKSKAVKKEVDGKTEELLPELSDEFAKTLGSFENIDALKNTIRLNITEEKKAKAREAKRMEILDKVAEKIEQEMPKYLIDLEKDKMLDEMKRNITQMGMKWEDYLAHIKKTEEELRNDWEKDAVKRVKYGYILDEMTEKEKIELPPEELDKEINAMIDYHKKLGQELDTERVRRYLTGIMRNEKLFQILENQN
ncbi:MAG: trigger factor [Patescibacteria group bacterium]